MRKLHGLPPLEWALMVGTTLVMVATTALGWWPLPWTEVLGFITGGVCVWLVVREQVWNWPVGLANNIFFFVLFMRSRLYADSGLQLIYFCLGTWGWSHWLFGGVHRTELRITRATRAEWLVLALTVPSGAYVLRAALLAINGAAPLLDALTTALSLAAQYLLCQKRLENWLFWIAADLIYIPLYLSRDLTLTATLYTVFLTMCCIGLRGWLANWRRERVPAP
jgi:nicotinamide mononucleotide transporter